MNDQALTNKELRMLQGEVQFPPMEINTSHKTNNKICIPH
jgi:hypothetical protein